MPIPGVGMDKAFQLQGLAAAEEEARRERAAEMLNVYHGFREEVLELVDAELRRVSDVDIEKIPRLLVNITRRVASQIAMVYKRPARRYFTDGKDEASERLKEILVKSDIDSASRSWDALGFLFNTVLVRPVVDGFVGKIPVVRFLTYNPAHTDVKGLDADYLKPEAVQYYTQMVSEFGAKSWHVTRWTATTAEEITTTGVTGLDGSDDTANKYGMLPFAVLRMEDMGEFWGAGADDLVDANVQFIAQLALLLENGMQQGFSIPFGVNTGLGRKVTVQSETSGGVTNQQPSRGLGPRVGIFVEDVAEGEVPPSLSFVTPDPLLDPISKILNMLVGFISWRYGLSSERVASVVNAAVDNKSGVSKQMDNADLEEIREQRLESFRRFEADLWTVLRRVLEVDGGVTFEESLVYHVDFSELDVKPSTADVVQLQQHQIANHIRTPVDFIMELNPDLDEKAAMEQFRKNKAINDELLLARSVEDALGGGDTSPREGEGGDAGSGEDDQAGDAGNA